MEVPNKKTMVSIFAGCVFLQMVCILALSANFLLAQTGDSTNPDNELQIQFDSFPLASIYEKNTISATTNIEPDSVEFKITGPENLTFMGMQNSPTNYYFIWNTINSPDGNYYVEAVAQKEAYETTRASFNIMVDNYDTTNDDTYDPITDDTTNTNSTVEITVQIADGQTAGTKDLFASTNYSLHNLTFYFDNLTSTTDSRYFPSRVSPDSDGWSTTINTSELPDGEYRFYAEGIYEYGGLPYESGNYINVTIGNDTTAADSTSNGDSSGTTSDGEIQIWIDSYPPSPIYGSNTISATTSIEPDSVEFRITGPENLTVAGMPNSLTNYYFVWETTNFPNGNYHVEAIAQKGTSRAYVSFGVEVNNSGTTDDGTYDPTMDDTTDTTDDYINDTTTDPLILTFIERFETPLFGDQPISISSTQEIYSCIFKIYGPRYAEFPMVKDGPTKRHIMLRTKDFPNGDYTIKVVAGNNIGTAEVRLDIRIENQTETEPDQPPVIEPAPDEPTPTEPISDEPVPRDPFYPTEPTEPISTEPIPADYSDQPIPDSSTEPYHPELISTQPEQPTIEITSECQEKGFSAEECLAYNQLPDDCRNAGISNPEACKKYMFEKYNGVENIPQDKFPIECQEANAKTADECDKIMRNIYLPEECKEQGIDDGEKCDLYLRQKHLPAECREAGAQSRSECDKIMFEKFGHPECREAGIESEAECQEFIFNKYAPQVECNNLEEWQCNNFIQERHLGNIVAKQTMFSELKENVAYLAGETIASEDLKEQLGENANIIPLKEEVKFKIILGEEKLTLDEEDNLIQTAPIILMIDSDMDGLPDDMEKRLGTDPNKADTDGDGYSDGEEVKNGNNPLGEGELKDEMPPIDEAILQNKTFGHPKTEGEEMENIIIKNIVNLKNKQGYALSGKSEPNSVVTLYIYSDLPLVITTKTDEYGNWQYELSEPLTDGEHEIYVAINDNTGKVVSKSKPLNFFVKEAKAISVKDFISPTASAASETEKESDSLIHYYLIIVILMITGILFFVAMIMKKKKRVVGI